MDSHMLRFTGGSRSLLAALIVVSLSVGGLPKPPASAASAPRSTLSDQAAVWHLNTATGHYTQGADGLTHVQLYNSPVAIPGDPAKGGWRLRNTGLTSSTSAASPADVPFKLQLSATSPSADIVGEDGVTLHVAVAQVGGVAPVSASSQVVGNARVYSPDAASPRADISLRSTISGFNARFVLHSAADAKTLGFSLVADPAQHVSFR